MIIDSSPLIIFSKIGRFDLLQKICNHVQITPSVYSEVMEGSKKNCIETNIIQELVEKKDITIIEADKDSQKDIKKIMLVYNIDNGEAESIISALNLKHEEILLDEISARIAAKSAGIAPIGSLRVLSLTYLKNIITKEEAKKLVLEMLESRYRFSSKIIAKFYNALDDYEKKRSQKKR